MKKGKSWPVFIGVFYGLFVLSLIGFMFFSFNNEVQMVTNNYYEKTLKYEEQITRIRNTNALATKPVFTPSKATNELFLVMPKIFNPKTVKGMITLFRPSDSSLDQVIDLKLSENNIQVISLSGLINGKWDIQLLWTDSKTDYYFKQVLIL
jgi:hypothetical protein